MKYIYHYREKTGYTGIIKNIKSFKFIKEFGILKLKKNQYFTEKSSDSEIGLVLLSGKCRIKIKKEEKDQDEILERKGVFEEKASGAYVSAGDFYEIFTFEDCMFAKAKVRSDIKKKSKIITPKDVNLRTVGKENYKRYVYDVLVGQIEGCHILMGETINPPGNWSSYPPHKHDKRNPPVEYKLEEIYFFKIQPEQGFGIQRIYGRNFDKIFTLKNNTLVIIPKGYHPVVAAPGYSLYYLWVLGGEKRILKPFTDPQHSWIL